MPQRHASAHELRQLPPFARLSKQELRCLERLRTNIPVPPGKVLARQGHPCLEFGIVIEGTALVTRDGHEIAPPRVWTALRRDRDRSCRPQPGDDRGLHRRDTGGHERSGVPLGVRDDACATRPHREPDRSPDRDVAGSEAIRSRCPAGHARARGGLHPGVMRDRSRRDSVASTRPHSPDSAEPRRPSRTADHRLRHGGSVPFRALCCGRRAWLRFQAGAEHV